MNHILIIRPHAQSVHTQETLTKRGYHTDILPLAYPVFYPLTEQIPPNTILIATSRFGIDSLHHRGEFFHLPLWVVGNQSASYAHQKGFQHVLISKKGTASGIAEAIIHDESSLHYLYSRAKEISFNMKEALEQNGKICQEWISYSIEDNLNNDYPDIIHKIQNRIYNRIIVYSVKMTDLYLGFLKRNNLYQDGILPLFLCLSQRIAEKLPPQARFKIATEPNEESVMALIYDHDNF